MEDEVFKRYFRLLKEHFDALKYFEDVSNKRRQDISIVNIRTILEEIETETRYKVAREMLKEVSNE